MRITFVVPTLNFNGGLRVIAVYADYLSRFGHDVTVVSPGKPTPTVKQRIKSFIKRQPWDGDKNFSTVYFDSLDINLKILDKSRPVMASDLPDADIVIATWWETAHWVNAMPMRTGKKVYFMQDYGCVPGQPLKEIQDTWLLPFYIITISKWLMKLIEGHTKNAKDVTLVSNGIDLSVFKTPERNKSHQPTVGFLYTDAPQKGAKLMLSAFIKAKETVQDLRLVMFGSKELPSDIENITDVTYHRKVSDEEIVNIYTSCDVWLFGSKREGFGLPILEAMACRTPVIATNAGAAEELVNRSSGALLTSDRVDEMASKIVEIVTLNNESWMDLSAGAYSVAEKHSWQTAASKFENTLQGLIN